MQLPLQLVILDNNGTIYDDLKTLAYGSVQAIFSVLNLPCPTIDVYRAEITSDFMQFYYRHGVPEEVTGEQLNGIRKLYYNARPYGARYRDGLEPFLKHCQEQGIYCAVCSAEINDVLIGRLNLAGIAEHFDVVRGSVWPRKAQALQDICRELAVAPNRAAMVGDTVEDLEDARAVGIRTVAFAHPTGYNSLQRLKAFEPDHLVNSIRELDALVTVLV